MHASSGQVCQLLKRYGKVGFVADDPTRIHTLRKYVGQAKDKTSVEPARSKQ